MKIFYKREKRIPFTKTGYEKLLEEKEKYLSERPQAVDHLRKAREMGDLSENGYYKASRQRLSFLDAQLKRVTKLITLAQVVSSKHDGTVDIGSLVEVKNDSMVMEFTIVGGYESSPKNQSISSVSPLGKALMGKRKGNKVFVTTPKGTVTYQIINVS
jgi:transcription elongation factor GreA